jgi:hypothetical protein
LTSCVDVSFDVSCKVQADEVAPGFIHHTTWPGLSIGYVVHGQFDGFRIPATCPHSLLLRKANKQYGFTHGPDLSRADRSSHQAMSLNFDSTNEPRRG